MNPRLLPFLSLVTASVLAQPAWAQTLGGGATGDIAWVRVVVALLLCLALGIGGAFALRARYGARTPQLGGKRWALGGALGLGEGKMRRLLHLETRPLGNQVTAWLIRCDDLEILVVGSPHSVSVLPLGQAAGAAERPE